MSTVALTGKDTINLNGRIFADFADADCAVLEFPNDLTKMKRGKNGNATISLDEMGNIADFSLRLIRGSPDDKFLNTLLTGLRTSPTTFVLLQGQFVKLVGDGTGVQNKDTYIVSGGVFKKQIGGTSSAEGNPEQGVVVYHLHFTSAARAIV